MSEELKALKIYVASSWRNDFQPSVVKALRKDGYAVYDFKDSEGFHWTEVDPEWKQWPNDIPKYLAGLRETLRKIETETSASWVIAALARGALLSPSSPAINVKPAQNKASESVAGENEQLREAVQLAIDWIDENFSRNAFDVKYPHVAEEMIYTHQSGRQWIVLRLLRDALQPPASPAINANPVDSKVREPAKPIITHITGTSRFVVQHIVPPDNNNNLLDPEQLKPSSTPAQVQIVNCHLDSNGEWVPNPTPIYREEMEQAVRRIALETIITVHSESKLSCTGITTVAEKMLEKLTPQCESQFGHAIGSTRWTSMTNKAGQQLWVARFGTYVVVTNGKGDGDVFTYDSPILFSALPPASESLDNAPLNQAYPCPKCLDPRSNHAHWQNCSNKPASEGGAL